MLTSFDRASISPVTVHRLQSWLKEKESATLWLSMPNGSESSSDSSNTAATIVKAISNTPSLTQLQLIFHFCELPAYELKLKDVGRHEAGVISLLYSLIVQLIHMLPPEVTCSKNLQEARFQKLDGTMRSWSDAVSLFEDLLALSLPYTFCIISGFEVLDYDDGVKSCREFALKMRQAVTSCGLHRALKVLFVTAGAVQSLSSLMQQSEVYCEREPARRR